MIDTMKCAGSADPSWRSSVLESSPVCKANVGNTTLPSEYLLRTLPGYPFGPVWDRLGSGKTRVNRKIGQWVPLGAPRHDPERHRKIMVFRLLPKSIQNIKNTPWAAKILDFHGLCMTFGKHFGIDVPIFSDSLKVMNSLHRA